jgi:hypothetical protein
MKAEERTSYQAHINKLKTDYEQKILDMQKQISDVEDKEAKRRVLREQVGSSTYENP